MVADETCSDIDMNSSERPIVLTIAGSDSSGGAGLQADLRTFDALGVRGRTAVTAITAQTDLEVMSIEPLSPAIVTSQIDAAVAAGRPAATKIGMLANAEIVEAVAAAIARHHLANVVLDPVMASTSGGVLLEPAALELLLQRLMPLSALITPNLAEAEALTGLQVGTINDMLRAAHALRDRGAQAVLIKGGHLSGPAIDIFDDGRVVEEIVAPRVAGATVRGTGCMLSAAIAARLAHGDTLVAAVGRAKEVVTAAIAILVC
jgi:hydroxymethylpyrimidine/phosphomethylpyrimidine kinase